MSLLRLLTSGKSLVDVKNTEPRYRVQPQALLPKFKSRKNPFRATTHPEGTPAARTPVAAPVTISPAAPAEPGSGAPSVPETQPELGVPVGAVEPAAPRPELSAAEPGPVAPSGAVEAVTERQPQEAAAESAPDDGRMARLFDRARGWLKDRRAGRKSKSAIPQFKPALVQAELRLDSVKVVRNDLSDSDLEIVAAKTPKGSATKPSPGPAEGASAPAAGQCETTDSAWGRVGARLFGADKPLA